MTINKEGFVVSNMLDAISTYLSRKKLQEKASCDDYILSLAEALKHVHSLMQEKIDGEHLVNLITKEALKQGMIIHFDSNKHCKKIG